MKAQVFTQYDKRFCQEGCLRKALTIDATTGDSLLNVKKCDGCEKFILACPHHAI
jgi:Fe-S-cluster-containing hydrogenase component 2